MGCTDTRGRCVSCSDLLFGLFDLWHGTDFVFVHLLKLEMIVLILRELVFLLINVAIQPPKNAGRNQSNDGRCSEIPWQMLAATLRILHTSPAGGLERDLPGQKGVSNHASARKSNGIGNRCAE